MSQVLCRLASYPFADWASFAVFAFAGKSLMKSWHELDDRVWFSLTNCRVMNFISLRKVTRKKESKKLKKPKKQRIWSFCAALQVVGPKPARSFLWRGEGGETSVGFRKAKVSLPLPLTHLCHCIFKALSNTCADNVLPSQRTVEKGKWGVGGVLDLGTDCPRARISVTCQTLLAFVPRPQKSALSAYKLITCPERFECPSTRQT